MKKLNLIELVKGKTATFQHYRDGLFWYKTEDGFAFPVPLSDCGEATTYNRTEKASLFMKYIRAQLVEVNLEAEKAKAKEDEVLKHIIENEKSF